MPIGNNIDPATLAAAKMAKMPAADMGAATSADIAAMPPKVAPQTGPEADSLAGLDSALALEPQIWDCCLTQVLWLLWMLWTHQNPTCLHLTWTQLFDTKLN